MERLLLVGLSLTMVACAGARAARASRDAAVAQQQQRADVVCRMERPTGSHIAERVCRSRDADDAQRLATQDALRRASQARPNTKD